MGYSVYPAASAAAKVEKTDRITATGAWVAPADVTKVEVILCGGGAAGGTGGGSSNGPGGGGGSVAYSVLTVSPSTSYTITIGAGGAGNATYGATGALIPGWHS